MQTRQFEIALSTFEKLRAAFPALSMNLDLRPAHVDLAMDIPPNRASPSRCTSTFRTSMNFICRCRLSGASGFPARTRRKSKGTSKRFQGYCPENFVSSNTGGGDVWSKHSYNVPAVTVGKTSRRGLTCQQSCLGRERPSRWCKTTPSGT